MPLKCCQFNLNFNSQVIIKIYTNLYFKLETLFLTNTYKVKLRKLVFNNHNIKSEINVNNNNIFLFNLSLIYIISYFFPYLDCLYIS
jgi:hypothetical protein